MAAVLRVLLAATWLLSGVAASSAQGYPSKSVRVVVGFPAGGPTDAIARIVAQKLSDNLGQQFYVENVGGAGGNTAAGQVARVTPDGYTIMVISTGFVVNPSLYAKVPYDPVKDFAPVTLVAVSPNVVVVNPQVSAKTLPELVQLIRDNPGKYGFAGPGIGSTPHLGGELFRLAFNARPGARAFHGCWTGDPGNGRRAYADRLHSAAACPVGGAERTTARAGRCLDRARRRDARRANLRRTGREGSGG